MTIETQIQDDIRAGQLRSDIIDINSYFPEATSLINQVYCLWKDVWHDVFAQSGSMESLNPDDLFRQNRCLVLRHNDDIIGFNFLTLFDGSNALHKDAAYVRGVFKALENDAEIFSGKRFSTIEYLTVCPKFRKLYPGISLGETLIRLSVLESRQWDMDFVLGTTRKDIGVTKIAIRAGFHKTNKTIPKCNYECDIVYFNNKLSSPPSDPLASIVHSLYTKGNQYKFQDKRISHELNIAVTPSRTVQV
ncbi:hypothetical protein [Pseudobacteriovorax antillogorgiicola]|uniref:N-acetyltransferase domain-containing protein n=1 Tax=Pseudobacteriovorax antillogorgiicola TaxID=1513793 RepID=A0A1Y6CR97_9BACT|nr:hypothetical protein [Pseudobacteriovorax antillogorgiicola]TCS45679.1 hypothetical protein EDD56_12773 [Pseudobacteriovorax antillogorgiicola]SMF73150.1 hypothetical protein SAMN06296036_12772 [Pseudobacteriovorax antillogorgiicola]